ncbi:MAG: tetratricopeptide repeat protein [Rhodospirillales bacterium]|nr:transglutaminase family protein [Alphaproteobacteria bacterium]MCB9977940.1 tetratricopeptide repeat protein [Rhodospirillales bacterium]
MAFDAIRHLSETASLPEGQVDLAVTAVALAVPKAKGFVVDRYLNHIKKICREVGERYAALIAEGAADDCGVRLAALKHVLSDRYGYAGDFDESNPDNASLVRTIDRGKGAPICLGMLYVQAARAQGWDVAGLDVPGLFVCRIEYRGQRIVFDPSDHCRRLEAAQLRAIVKSALGENAELSASYFEPLGNLDWLIRMQNIVKLRQIDAADYEAALQTVERMRLLNPNEFRLLLDAGVLYAKTHKIPDAIAALEDYIAKAGNPRDRQDAALLLQKLKDEINGQAK